MWFLWLVNFHNSVNQQTNDKNKTDKRMYSYKEAEQQYNTSICVHNSK